MIKSIAGSATRKFVEGRKSGFSGIDVDLARQRLSELNAASALSDLANLNSVGLHKLHGPLRNFWSIDVNGKWRIVFRFRKGDAFEMEITDTH